MAKSSSKSKEAALTESKPAVPETENQSGNGSVPGEKRPAAKGAAKKPAKAGAKAKAAGKSRGTAPRKSAAPRKPRALKPGNSKARRTSISDEDIRIRAYFISERRQQEGRPGDSAHDWLEAHRQLQEEASERA